MHLSYLAPTGRRPAPRDPVITLNPLRFSLDRILNHFDQTGARK